MRPSITLAAIATAILALPPVLAATYTSDATYQFSGQYSSNSGRGIAVNSTDTRLFETVRNASTGKVLVMDTAGGAVVGSITPASPTTINDIALSPDDTTLYFVKATSTSWELDSAPASDGAHTSADVTTIVADIGATPGGIATAKSGATVYLAIATVSSLQIYTSVSGGAFTKQSDIALSSTTKVRDVAALDTGAGLRFYVLTPGTIPQTAIAVFDSAGGVVSQTWTGIPAAFVGYIIDSITAAGTIDGVASLFLTADGADNLGNPVLTSFRYGYDGIYKNDGFGYGLSTDATLQQLQPLDTTPTLAPGCVAGSHVYLGAALPDTIGNPIDQTVRALITPTTLQPGTITGNVTEVASPSPRPSVGATVVIGGLDTPVAVTGADGSYILPSVQPGTLTLGASRYGYVSNRGTVTLNSGETKAAAGILLPDLVPAYTLARAFAPPIADGELFPGKYLNPSMQMYTLGGGTMSGSIQTIAYAMYDDSNLYIAVYGLEPSLGLNRAAYGNLNMLTQDDNVQIYLDPPHRHDVKGVATNLFQFAANIPPVVGGVPVSLPLSFQRRINPDGTGAEDVSSYAWQVHLGYTGNSWTLEARIALDMLTPFAPPTTSSIWGLLVARHRPSAHADSLPADYSTSDVQSGRFTDSTTWTDVKFGAAVPNVKGDVNQNGVLDPFDVAYVLRMAAGLSYGAFDPADPNANLTIRNQVLASADVWPTPTPDGKITLEDAVRVARAMNGIGTLP
ncbi:MAG TPA: hypothetical protein VGM51_09020 [Armatimonadota bacterium]